MDKYTVDLYGQCNSKFLESVLNYLTRETPCSFRRVKYEWSAVHYMFPSECVEIIV